MKAQFFGSLDARNIEGKWWQLLAPLGFYSAKYDVTICTPAGFVTDFASVPRLPVTYWAVGGTGKWKATIHDLPYRFGNFPRVKTDLIFHEAGRVRAKMRENQAVHHQAGRWARDYVMTAGVLVFGRASFRAKPGCLDDRKDCDQVCRIDTQGCEHYYLNWRQCVLPGFRPDILELHRSIISNQ